MLLCQQGWGKTIVVGVEENPEAKFSLNCTQIVLTEKTIKGCAFGGFKPKSHIPILIKRYLDKVLCAISSTFFFSSLCSLSPLLI